MSKIIPQSLAPVKNAKEEQIVLPSNSRRWWENERIREKPEIVVPLISVQEALDIKKNKIIIDVRPFTSA